MDTLSSIFYAFFFSLRNGVTLHCILNGSVINSDALSWFVQAHCGHLRTLNV